MGVFDAGFSPVETWFARWPALVIKLLFFEIGALCESFALFAIESFIAKAAKKCRKDREDRALDSQ